MLKTLKTILGTAALGATAVIPLHAQTVREGARSSPADAQISFGYLCDDRFVVRNEGATPVNLEYGLTRNDERTALQLDKDESIELMLSTSDELGLYVGGKVLATARRDYRDCDELEGESPRVIVRPLAVVYSPRVRVIVAPYPVYRAYYDPWYHRHYSYPRTVVHTVIRVPIVINRRSSSGGRDYGRDAGRDAGRNTGRSGGRDAGKSSTKVVVRDRGNGDRGHDNGRRGR